MADEKIDIDLDPKKMLAALNDLSESAKKLAEDCEKALAKEAPKSIAKLEEAAEKGTTKITTFFKNLGTRVKEDLKTAFDASGVMAGMKFGKDLGEGVKQVFEMEKAFDRLNTRLKLSVDQMSKFKSEVGRKVAATGQKLEDVLPGVETAAAKGGVKSPEDLANIGEMLGQAKATTGEDTSSLAETVVQILKNQGEKVTAQSFKKTMDALQGTRVSGAFNTTEEAGKAVEEMTKNLDKQHQKSMGLGTRELGGLAATASKGGQGGIDTLNKILQMGQSAGGQNQVNAMFGAQIFKNGKFDASAFQKVNKQGAGQFTSQVRAGQLGADQGDLERLVDNMKEGMGDFKKVVDGANETADQFEQATDNMASGFEEFKESLKMSTRELGEHLSTLGHEMLKGNFKGAMDEVKAAGRSAWEHKGTLAAGIGMTAGIGMLAGGGLNSLLKKIPGVGGVVGGLAGGELAKQAGVQPVYVVNASEIGGGLGGAAGGLGGLAGKAGGIAAKGAGVLAAGAVGYEVGKYLMDNTPLGAMSGKATDYLADKVFGPGETKPGDMSGQAKAFNTRNQTNLTAEEYAKAVETGTLKAHQQTQKNQKVNYTNPSAYPPRGPGI